MKTGEIKRMISHGKDIKIFSGNSNPELAKAICKELGLPLGDSECGNFSDGETFVSIYAVSYTHLTLPTTMRV